MGFKSIVVRFCLVFAACFLGNFGSSATTSLAQTPTPSQWRLVWSDEFETSEIDSTKWDFDLQDGFFDYQSNTWISGWGNGELQYYTKENRNVRISNGNLVIRALKESFGGKGYTSARIKSKGRDDSTLFSQTYGRFEFRAKLPTGAGVWPALWMLPQSEDYGAWASSGEIDVLEAKGQEPNRIHGTIHYGARWPANRESTASLDLPAGQRIDQFHTYAIEWEPGEIRWYFDGNEYAKQTFWWSSSQTDNGRGLLPANQDDINPWPAPFNKPFYIVMNVAVGGQFVGNPKPDTNFPAEMLVDYVRVYEKSETSANQLKPRGAGQIPTR